MPSLIPETKALAIAGSLSVTHRAIVASAGKLPPGVYKSLTSEQKKELKKLRAVVCNAVNTSVLGEAARTEGFETTKIVYDTKKSGVRVLNIVAEAPALEDPASVAMRAFEAAFKATKSKAEADAAYEKAFAEAEAKLETMEA